MKVIAVINRKSGVGKNTTASSIFNYAPKSNAASDYSAVIEEILKEEI